MTIENSRLPSAPSPITSGTAGLMAILRDPACVIDDTGLILDANAAWWHTLDHSGTATHWATTVAVADRDLVVGELLVAQSSAQRVDLECRLVCADHRPRWFRVSIYPVDDQGPDIQWLCTATDIDELKTNHARIAERSSMQTDMLDVSVDCIKMIALDGTLIHMNRAGCLALGVPEGVGFGQEWLPLLPGDVRAEGEQALQAARTGQIGRFAGRSELPGGRPQYWDNTLTPVPGPDGATARILCVSREVTAEREAQNSLRANQERLALATHVGGLGIWDYDVTEDRLHCDDTWYQIMGRDPDQPIGSIAGFRSFIHPDDVDAATEVTHTAAELLTAGADYAAEFRIIRPTGEIRWVRSAAALQRDADAVRAVGFVVDATEEVLAAQTLLAEKVALEKEKESLARQSLEDALTGIANRRRLDHELAELRRDRTRSAQPVCVGLIDVDSFKAYNDRYGHLAGDTALRRVATALRAAARDGDLVARYGGEEFAFVVVGTRDPQPILDRFMAAVATLGIENADTPTGLLTISVGCVVTTTFAQQSATTLLELGDEALYEAKESGRNRYVVYPADSRSR
ncbi:diguanylate cyclase [Gordonia sp. ABSL1-1]|uniref:sensor domain-containing diguanylate cyclase n=1 Tax=Gordonia sp. ABSL1-1 TaxID=3053923 RepID=UPI002573F9EF|nr:diguanylate cyclase [Gordonia sp. ABSL1-1]MDL9935543.1 diguanylate cyclase [Gordonia sp. ABSL1-1]